MKDINLSNKFIIAEDGSGQIVTKYCKVKKYSSDDMKKKWEKWYKQIINPYRVNNMLEVNVSDIKVCDLPGIRYINDILTDRITEDYFINNLKITISVAQIIGLYLINYDIDISNHKIKFIESINKKFILKIINELDELITGLNNWIVKKNLLKMNKNKWFHYDSSISQLKNIKPKFELITDNDKIKIQMLGSALYDNLFSFDKYLYLMLSIEYPDRDSISKKYIKWLNNK